MSVDLVGNCRTADSPGPALLDNEKPRSIGPAPMERSEAAKRPCGNGAAGERGKGDRAVVAQPCRPRLAAVEA